MRSLQKFITKITLYLSGPAPAQSSAWECVDRNLVGLSGPTVLTWLYGAKLIIKKYDTILEPRNELTTASMPPKSITKRIAFAVLGTQNAARRVLDSVQVLSSTVSALSSSSAVVGQTTKTVSGWMADKIAPDYWRPNHEITNCNSCGVNFGVRDNLGIHHCRACGEGQRASSYTFNLFCSAPRPTLTLSTAGFCNDCSKYKRPVPERGWEDPVRVCRGCMNGHVDRSPLHGSAAEAVQARM